MRYQPLPWNYNEVERLASAFCTPNEIATHFNLTLADIKQELEKNSDTFDMAYNRGRNEGIVNAKLALMHLVMKKNCSLRAIQYTLRVFCQVFDDIDIETLNEKRIVNGKLMTALDDLNELREIIAKKHPEILQELRSAS